MCGICGLTTEGDADHAAVVTRMNAAIVHRGPDDAGSYSDATTSLAMRRLSIIDRAGGHQPIVNEDGTLVIVFNGEIYNYRELREELLRSGRHIFRTQSDTEVILHAFEEFGERVPERLEGMFAFCIYRTTDRSFFFARDRFGEKPLFNWQGGGGTLAFSSELASLLEWARFPDKHLIRGDVKKYILREAIREWLPDEVFSHPKMGFGIPLHAFVNRQYAELCGDLLLGDRDGLAARLFRRAALETFVRRGLDRMSDRADLSVHRASHQLWALLQLAAWAKSFRVTL